MKILRRISVFSLVVCVAVYLAGFAYFVSCTNGSEDAARQKMPDALAVFTGGYGRVDAGVRYVQSGFAGPILITGVNSKVNKHLIFKDYDLTPEQLEKIELDYTALKTQDNVTVTAAWQQQNNFETVGVVTEYYHIPRSRLFFERLAPQAHVTMLPVFSGTADWHVLLKEYTKYLLVYVAV